MAFKVGNEAQMMAVLTSIADHIAAPTLSIVISFEKEIM